MDVDRQKASSTFLEQKFTSGDHPRSKTNKSLVSSTRIRSTDFSLFLSNFVNRSSVYEFHFNFLFIFFHSIPTRPTPHFPSTLFEKGGARIVKTRHGLIEHKKIPKTVNACDFCTCCAVRRSNTSYRIQFPPPFILVQMIAAKRSWHRPD